MTDEMIEEAAIRICKSRTAPGEDWRMWWCKPEHRQAMLLDALAVLQPPSHEVMDALLPLARAAIAKAKKP